MRKRGKAGILALALAAVGVGAAPGRHALVSSAETVQRCINGLKAGNSALNPLERLVLSLAMANSKPSHPRNAGTTPDSRT